MIGCLQNEWISRNLRCQKRILKPHWKLQMAQDNLHLRGNLWVASTINLYFPKVTIVDILVISSNYWWGSKMLLIDGVGHWVGLRIWCDAFNCNCFQQICSLWMALIFATIYVIDFLTFIDAPLFCSKAKWITKEASNCWQKEEGYWRWAGRCEFVDMHLDTWAIVSHICYYSMNVNALLSVCASIHYYL